MTANLISVHPLCCPSPPQEKLEALAQRQVSTWLNNEQITFLYRGYPGLKHVELAGELTGWHRSGLVLQKHPNNLHSITLKLPETARLEYKFLVDNNWELDPWNPCQADSGIGSLNSYVTMPKYALDPLTQSNKKLAQGQVKAFMLKGQSIPGQRHLYVYLPPNYSERKKYPVIYAHDGGDYIHRGQLPTILDNLIAQGRIEPTIAVCIDPIERFREYTLNIHYCELLVKEIVPLIDKTYATRQHPRSRTLLGSSLGGLISTYMAYHYSHIFGQVLGQSSSFQYFGERLVHTLQNLQTHPLRLYLSAGQFEGLIKANRHMHSVLTQKDYEFQYDEYAEGHNWTHWKHRLSKGLEYLLGNKSNDRIL